MAESLECQHLSYKKCISAYKFFDFSCMAEIEDDNVYN